MMLRRRETILVCVTYRLSAPTGEVAVSECETRPLRVTYLRKRATTNPTQLTADCCAAIAVFCKAMIRQPPVTPWITAVMTPRAGGSS
jgi:hypothetical protein